MGILFRKSKIRLKNLRAENDKLKGDLCDVREAREKYKAERNEARDLRDSLEEELVCVRQQCIELEEQVSKFSRDREEIEWKIDTGDSPLIDDIFRDEEIWTRIALKHEIEAIGKFGSFDDFTVFAREPTKARTALGSMILAKNGERSGRIFAVSSWKSFPSGRAVFEKWLSLFAQDAKIEFVDNVSLGPDWFAKNHVFLADPIGKSSRLDWIVAILNKLSPGCHLICRFLNHEGGENMNQLVGLAAKSGYTFEISNVSPSLGIFRRSTS